MEKITQKIKLNEFMNLFCQLFLNVNRLFVDLKTGKKQVEIFTKAENEKFTNFDWTIQKMIQNYLGKYYSGINFVGEENTKVDTVNNNFSEYITKVEDLNYFPISEEFVGQDNCLYNVSDLCIYCDPIDSTGSFIKGNYEPVTCLVGVTHKGVPVLGFIHFLSYLKGEPKTFFNVPKRGIFSLCVDDSIKSNEEIKAVLVEEKIVKHEKMNFIITSTRENETMTKSNFFIKT